MKIGLVLIIIGFVASVAFGIVAGASFTSYFGDEDYTYVEKTYALDDFTGFDISLDNKAVIVLPSETGNVEIKYYDSDLNWINVDESGSTLIMESDHEWYANLVVNFNFISLAKYADFYLYIPVTENYDIKIQTANGIMTMDDYLNAGVIDLATSNGTITLTNVASDSTIDLKSSNGRIELTNVESPDEISMDTMNGRIVMNQVETESIVADTSNGKVTGSGIVTSNLEAHTSNGDIELSLQGSFADYHIQMSTSNGGYYLNGDKVTLNVYNTDKTNDIDLDTSNGNIEISFSS